MSAVLAAAERGYSILGTIVICGMLLLLTWALGTAARHDPSYRRDATDRRDVIDPRKLQESIDNHPSGRPRKD